MCDYPKDIYTEPPDQDGDTLKNLGPLAAMAGICSNLFLEHAFKTVEFRIKATINPDGTWSYDEHTVLMHRGQTEPFHHTDHNTLTRIAAPTPNPLASA